MAAKPQTFESSPTHVKGIVSFIKGKFYVYLS